MRNVQDRIPSETLDFSVVLKVCSTVTQYNITKIIQYMPYTIDHSETDYLGLHFVLGPLKWPGVISV